MKWLGGLQVSSVGYQPAADVVVIVSPPTSQDFHDELHPLAVRCLQDDCQEFVRNRMGVGETNPRRGNISRSGLEG